MFSLSQGSTVTDKVIDRYNVTVTDQDRDTVTDKDTDTVTAGSQLLSKTLTF